MIREGDKNKIVRPEQIAISEADNNSISAEVLNTAFFGSYQEVEISVMDQRYILRDFSMNIHPGDHIHIRFS